MQISESKVTADNFVHKFGTATVPSVEQAIGLSFWDTVRGLVLFKIVHKVLVQMF